MSRFKVGDKVRVRADLVKGEKYGEVTLLRGNMSEQKGRISEVEKIIGGNKYYLSNGFYWAEDMLELAPTLSEIKEKKLDYIIHVSTQEEANILCEELGVSAGWHRPANECWQYYDKDTHYIIQDGIVHHWL